MFFLMLDVMLYRIQIGQADGERRVALLPFEIVARELRHPPTGDRFDLL